MPVFCQPSGCMVGCGLSVNHRAVALTGPFVQTWENQSKSNNHLHELMFALNADSVVAQEQVAGRNH